MCVQDGHDPGSDASRLRAALDALGWTRADLAGRLGIREDSVRKMTMGRQAVAAGLLPWIEAAAAYLTAEPLPPGWQAPREAREKTA